jgi:hypothetical protein
VHLKFNPLNITRAKIFLKKKLLEENELKDLSPVLFPAVSEIIKQK